MFVVGVEACQDLMTTTVGIRSLKHLESDGRLTTRLEIETPQREESSKLRRERTS